VGKDHPGASPRPAEKRKYQNIAKVLKVTQQDVLEASAVIIHELERGPAVPSRPPTRQYVVPDVYVVKSRTVT